MTAVPAATAPSGPDRSQSAWRRRISGVLNEKAVRIVYQPIMDVRAGTVAGYEALARFDEPGLSVEEWFAAARAAGMAAQLEAAAISLALAARPSLPNNCFLTVNVSPAELSEPLVQQALAAAGDLAGVVLEVTEQTVVESYPELERQLRRWRNSGALVAVDDAGAGYAGLRHLLELRPSIIKLDRHLVDRIDRDPAKRVLAEMIGTFADRTDAWVLAEGIERRPELDVIAELGIPLAQGYFVGRPAPGWSGLGEASTWAAYREAPVRAARPGTVAAHLVACPMAADLAAASALLGADDDLDWVVVADRLGRPSAVVSPDDLVANGPGAGQQVNAGTPAAQALRRAMARSAGQRFAPLIVIDEVGRYLGIAPIDRLVDGVAAQA
ncbi:EAL domain-containing protein [Acidiferrimicrobium sp. IK]|uniref:EAL domain-containing protein n=1 Tax=Acidiferrimicrobium sp. IK TaxID=2871700 RepID=UPI0021CB2398|nr:EAL domain-containing protein [Acidiferrimicrobium sp. IK]MCU4182751.1 EAL domain-containing protein [Acidiferrimicrobium sp. IK]